MVELVPGIFRPRRHDDGDEDATLCHATLVAYVNLFDGERIRSSTIEKSPAYNGRFSLIGHLGKI